MSWFLCGWEFNFEPVIAFKYFFTFIILIHGLIHLIGFAKAFQFGSIEQLTKEISRPVGLLWLLVMVLFIFTLIAFMMNNTLWPTVAFVAVLLSQILIILVWKDAKFGTIANILILLVALPTYANFQFATMAQRESITLLSGVQRKSTVVKPEEISHLPSIIQTWLNKSGTVGKEKAYSARIQQSGRMRTTPDGKWMDFTAQQYYAFEHPGFVWTTRVNMMPLVYMDGRDKFESGKGHMLIKLLSLIPVVHEEENEKINTGTMLRYLGELCWFPSAALSPYITWKEIDSTSVSATMTFENTRVTGNFRFTQAGDMVSFEAERYYGGGEDARLEKWCVVIDDYKTFDGIRVPYKSSVVWKLKEDDFTWLTLEITHLEVNQAELYKHTTQ